MRLLGALSVLTTLLWAIPAALGAETAAAKDPPGALRFENYEGFLGFGASDETAAKRDFLQVFPIGTPLDQIEPYFKKIGGRCFELPRDRPGQLLCDYAHPKFRLAPFLPILVYLGGQYLVRGRASNLDAS